MIQVLAPAKVNLGLEILGKRDDGYHEVRTILCAVSVFDIVEFDSDARPGLHVDDPALEANNLVESALRLVSDFQPELVMPAVRLRKRIPAAAGLGGASSDAAATLLAIQHLFPRMLEDCTMHTLASKLGSDVPFFLRSGLAVGTGRGELLQHVPYQQVEIVIVNPPLLIAGKTATMYGLLDRSDWTDGSAIEALASMFGRRGQLRPELPLPNTFKRPLYTLHPHLAPLSARIARLTGLPVQLTGAGPAHFVVCHDDQASAMGANRLRESLGQHGVRVLAGRSVPSVMMRAS